MEYKIAQCEWEIGTIWSCFETFKESVVLLLNVCHVEKNSGEIVKGEKKYKLYIWEE